MSTTTNGRHEARNRRMRDQLEQRKRDRMRPAMDRTANTIVGNFGDEAAAAMASKLTICSKHRGEPGYDEELKSFELSQAIIRRIGTDRYNSMMDQLGI